jgi:hypothetical protein
MADPTPESLVRVYARIGEGLNAWAAVEDLVTAVFLVAISARNHDAARAAFHEVVSFDGRLSACNAAVQIALAKHHPHLAEWDAPRERLRKKKNIRNKLAHGQPLAHKGKPDWRYFPFYSINDDATPDWNGGWTLDRLKGFIQEFIDLRNDLTAFIKRLREDLGMWPTDWRPKP